MKYLSPAIVFAFLGLGVVFAQDGGVMAPLPGADFAGNYRVARCSNLAMQPPVNASMRLVSRMHQFDRPVPVVVFEYGSPIATDAGLVSALGGITAINVSPVNLPWVDNGQIRAVIYTARTQGLGLIGSHRVVLTGNTHTPRANFTPVTELDEQMEVRFTNRSRRTLNYRYTLVRSADGIRTTSQQTCVFDRL